MKIWFNSLTRTTILDTDAVIDKMFVELDKPAYRVTKQSLNYVEFKEIFWRADWNFNQLKYINGGTFRINPENKTVVLSYYLNLVYDVVFNLVFILLGIFKDSNFFFFNILIGVKIMVRLIFHRITAAEIIDRVVNT
jgi:hypothetical protein